MNPRLIPAALVATGLLLIDACASTGTASKAAVLSAGVFTPSTPPASDFGPQPTLICPAGGALGALTAAVKRESTGGPAAMTDGRLCALAEALIDWDDKKTVATELNSFLSAYYGLPSNVRLTLATTNTDRAGDVGERLVDAVIEFQTKALQPLYGLATKRIAPKAAARGETARGSTKLVLAFWDAPFTLAPLPRKLAAGQTATVSGTLLGDAANPTVEIGLVDGKVETPAQAPGNAFNAEVRCGDKAGDIHVEIAAEIGGGKRKLTNLTIACGGELATNLALPEPLVTLDAGAEEKKLFDQVNAERTALGLPALQYDESVAKVARVVAEGTRDQLAKGAVPESADIVSMLKQNEVMSSVIIVNPARATTPEAAQAMLKTSPQARAQYLTTSATHGGFGLAELIDANGAKSVVLEQVFVKMQPPHDLPKLKQELQAGVLRRRSDARAGGLEADADLEKAATTYVAELAASRNNLPKERDEAILGPLRKKWSTIQIVAGAPPVPADFAEEPGIVTSGRYMGLAVAEGSHPVMGKGTLYVVLIIGNKRGKK